MHSKLRHSSLLHWHSVRVKGDSCKMILEHFPLSLHEFLQQHGEKLTFEKKWDIVRRIVMGMQHVHGRNYYGVHWNEHNIFVCTIV